MSETASLRELVDLNELQTIQDSFAKTAGTSSVIFSPEGEPLTQFSNPTSLCSLIQSTEEGKRRCFLSFMEMSSRALELEEPKIQYCFAQCGHFVAPIIIDGEHKGMMFAGQFIPQEFSTEHLNELKKIAVEINVDSNLLVEEAKKMRVVEEDAVWNYSNLLFRIVAVIARLGAQADELNRAKDALQKAHNGLEIRVRERTAELAKSNEQLKREIREHKRAEEALRDSGERYRSLVESTDDSIYTLNREGRYLFANKKLLSVLGLPLENVVGRYFSAFLSGETAKEFNEKMNHVFETGKSVTYECRDQGGNWLLRTLSPIKDFKTGEITAVTGITKSITELKRAEEMLQKEKNRAQMYLSVAGVMFVVIGADQKVSLINKKGCEILGYNEKEIIGKNWFDTYIPERDRAEVKAAFDQLMAGEIEPVEYFENTVLTKSGMEKIIAWHNTQLHDEKGKITATLSSGEDITERKRAREELREYMTELEQFNRLAVNREQRMIELKREVNRTYERLGEKPPYDLSFANEGITDEDLETEGEKGNLKNAR